MDPLLLVLIVAAVVCAFCWIASLITKDTSWVDRIWSIVPVVYVWIFAIAALVDGADATRLIVMAVLVTAWGARLTFNFARKGGYTGMEDYRWAVLRGRMKPWQFQVFNLLFIVLYQNALLVLITHARLHRLAAPRAIRTVGCRVRRAVRRIPRGGVRRRPAAVELPPCEEGGRGPARAGLRHDGSVRLQPPPQLLLRAGAVVGVLCDRGDGGRSIRTRPLGRRAQLDDPRRGAAHRAVHRLDDLHRVDHASKYPAYADYQRRTSMLLPLPPAPGADEAPKTA